MNKPSKPLKVHDIHVNLSESGKWFDTGLDASYERIVDVMNVSGVSKAALLAMPGACTNLVFSSSKIDRNRFWCFGNLDFSRLNYTLDQIFDLDLDGIKIHPRFQRIGIDAMLAMDFLSKLEEKGVPLMICGWQQSSTIPIASLNPLHVDLIAKKYPKLPIILSHLGGHRFWDAFAVARSNPLVYLDCSYFLQAFRGTSLESDFLSSLQMIDRKVIFGSDFPEINPSTYLDALLQGTRGMSEIKMANVFYLNLERLMSGKVT